MKKKTSSEIDSTISDLRALVQDAEKVLAAVGDEANEETTRLRARLRAALNETHEVYDRARESAREQIEWCDDYVRTHPYHALGIAAAVGALVGLLTTRRS